MGIKIEIKNSKITDNAGLLNQLSAKGNSETEIKIDGLQLEGAARVLENIQLDDLRESISERMEVMDPHSREYGELKKILQKNLQQNEMKKRILEHIADFSQGVLANLISGWILK